jgi:hypothetical protein
MAEDPKAFLSVAQINEQLNQQEMEKELNKNKFKNELKSFRRASSVDYKQVDINLLRK